MLCIAVCGTSGVVVCVYRLCRSSEKYTKMRCSAPTFKATAFDWPIVAPHSSTHFPKSEMPFSSLENEIILQIQLDLLLGDPPSARATPPFPPLSCSRSSFCQSEAAAALSHHESREGGGSRICASIAAAAATAASLQSRFQHRAG